MWILGSALKTENIIKLENFDLGIGEKGSEETRNDTINWFIVYWIDWSDLEFSWPITSLPPRIFLHSIHLLVHIYASAYSLPSEQSAEVISYTEEVPSLVVSCLGVWCWTLWDSSDVSSDFVVKTNCWMTRMTPEQHSLTIAHHREVWLVRLATWPLPVFTEANSTQNWCD